jgi:hypothetical protein
LDALLLFLLTAVLILPLFRIDYLNDWMSIEGSFIADARYIRDHWPHPSWHALWYCGTRFDYIYPPATRYGASIAAMLLGVSAARGYHVYCGLVYCLGVAGVYFLVRAGSRSRAWAWVAACAEALLSPEFAFLKEYRADSQLWMPERLNVLIKWGEGPHTCALAFLPWGVGFCFLAFRGGRRWTVAAAALCFGLAVSNNLYGALALGIFFPLAVWAAWLERRERAVWLRAAVIVALTAGLCAWWLTPSFVRITQRNLVLVAIPGNIWSKVVGALLVLVFAAGSWWVARRMTAPAWPVFVAGSALAFLVEVVGQFWFHFRIWGEPMRFVPELDMVLILAMVECLRRLERVHRRLAAVLAVIGFCFALRYVSNPWSVFAADPNWRQRIEYRMPEWIAHRFPGARVFATGSVSFWYDVWRDLPQVSGASDQGMQDLMPALARYQIMVGTDARRDIDWLQALGADLLVVNGPGSQEVYHSIQQAGKFAGLLPVVLDREGDVVYRVPRHPGLARVVNEATMADLAPIPWSNEDGPALRAYAQAVESSQAPVVYERPAIDEIRIRATTGAGDSVLIQESWDPGWRAWVDGQPAPVRRDVMYFMRVRTPAGSHRIRFAYEPPFESRAGLGISLASLLALLLLAGGRSFRRRR